MGFNLFHAIGGAAEQYTKMEDEKRRANLEDARETQRWIRDNAATAFQEYKTKKEDTKKLANSLKALGLDDDRTLGLIEYDPEKAKLFVEKAPAYLGALKQSGKNITANDLITIADPEYTGVPLDEGLDNVVGIYTASGEEFDTTTPEGKAYAKLGRVLGMDPAEVMAISTGKLTTKRSGPAIGFSDEFLSMESLGLRSEMTALEKLKAETVQEQAEASVAGELAGIKLAKEGMGLDLLAEQITAKRNENADYQDNMRRIREKHDQDMLKAIDEDTKRDIELIYLSDSMAADLAYTRAQTKKAMRPDGTIDPGVALKRYQGTFAVGMNAATEMTELGKYLKMVPQPDGTYAAEYIGKPEARAQVADELKNVTLQFLKGVFATEGAQPAALSAAMSMNPMIDSAIEKVEGPEGAKRMASNPFVPFRYKDPETGVPVVGYYDSELGKPVKVSAY